MLRRRYRLTTETARVVCKRARHGGLARVDSWLKIHTNAILITRKFRRMKHVCDFECFSRQRRSLGSIPVTVQRGVGGAISEWKTRSDLFL